MLFALSVLLTTGGGQGKGSENPLNEVVLLDLAGRPVNPLKADESRAVVFIFVRTDCPISNRYTPEVRRLSEKFGVRGVRFRLIYPDPDESAEAIRRHVREHNLAVEALRDPRHTLVKVTGVRVTPEAAVFVPRGPEAQMVYRGRIDDWYVDFGKTRPEPTTHDLERALDAVLGGRQVRNPRLPAVGCSIPDLP